MSFRTEEHNLGASMRSKAYALPILPLISATINALLGPVCRWSIKRGATIPDYDTIVSCRKASFEMTAPLESGGLRQIKLLKDYLAPRYGFDMRDLYIEDTMENEANPVLTRVPAGTISDGASAPVGRQRFILAHFQHDRRYSLLRNIKNKKQKKKLRKLIDKAFALDVLLLDNQNPPVAYVAYLGVRLFGGSHAK